MNEIFHYYPSTHKNPFLPSMKVLVYPWAEALGARRVGLQYVPVEAGGAAKPIYGFKIKRLKEVVKREGLAHKDCYPQWAAMYNVQTIAPITGDNVF